MEDVNCKEYLRRGTEKLASGIIIMPDANFSEPRRCKGRGRQAFSFSHWLLRCVLLPRARGAISSFWAWRRLRDG